MSDENVTSLLAGLAHEMNTPLGAIKSNTEILDMALRRIAEFVNRSPESTDLQEILAIIESSLRTNRLACERLISMVDNVRQFARVEDSERKKTNIHQHIENTLALLAYELKYRIRVVKDFGTIHDIDAFPGQLNQLLLNILQNAIQSISGDGEIHIRTWESPGAVHIAISDTGRGIPEAVLPRIFEPGFTTRKSAHGEGLGLAICSRIVQNHNGRIDVESREGKGSTFNITLERNEND